VLSGRGLCDELITRPEESYQLCCVVVCDLETSRMGAPYIHDVSRLRVNNLTLILLTWRKWWAPNNASKEEMGFNSGFKGLKQSTSSWCFYSSYYNDVRNHEPEIYQEYFLGVKAAGVYGWQTYHFHVPIFLKSGSLNLLEILTPSPGL